MKSIDNKLKNKFFNNIKKNKIRIYSIFFTIIIGTSVIMGFALGKNDLIVASGSTTVLPMLETLGQNYYDKTKKKLTVEPGGSTTGIRLIQSSSKLTDIGDASRYPKITSEEYQSHDWKNLSTITMSYDTIIFAVNLKGTGYKSSLGGNTLNLKIEDIEKIYSGEITTWNNLVAYDPDTGLIRDAKSYSASDNVITTIMRDPGSGTRDAFFNALDKYFPNSRKHEDIWSSAVSNNTVNDLENGSNGGVASDINSVSGSIGYVSLGFFKQVKNDSLVNIRVNSHQIFDLSAAASGNDLSELYKFEKDIYDDSIKSGASNLTSLSGYKFYHPMNTIINVKNKSIQLVKEFIADYCFANNEEILESGYIPFFGYDNSANARVINFKHFWQEFCMTPDYNKYGEFSNIIPHSSSGNPWWFWNPSDIDQIKQHYEI